MTPEHAIEPSWKDSIFRQREELARMLREPIARLAGRCAAAWGSRDGLNGVLREGVSGIPYCTYLYVVGTDGIQRSDSVGTTGILTGHYGRDRSERPYLREAIPPWGFLLSDAYIGLTGHRPSLTALQVVAREGEVLGLLGANFDLRRLPVTSVLYH